MRRKEWESFVQDSAKKAGSVSVGTLPAFFVSQHVGGIKSNNVCLRVSNVGIVSVRTFTLYTKANDLSLLLFPSLRGLGSPIGLLWHTQGVQDGFRLS